MEMNEDGIYGAVGAEGGEVYVVSISDNLVVSGKMDKMNIGNMFEREAKREKILHVKKREIQFREKSVSGETQGEEEGREDEVDDEVKTVQANDSAKKMPKGVKAKLRLLQTHIHARGPDVAGKPDAEERQRKMLEKAEKDFFDTISKIKREREEKGNLPNAGQSWGSAAKAVLFLSGSIKKGKSTIAEQ